MDAPHTSTRRTSGRRSGAERDLDICPSCSGALVYPVSWEQRCGDRWHIERRCPECEWRGQGEHELDAVDRFDDALTEGTEMLLQDLRLMARANMEEDVAMLVSALRSGAIQPMDF